MEGTEVPDGVLTKRDRENMAYILDDMGGGSTGLLSQRAKTKHETVIPFVSDFLSGLF